MSGNVSNPYENAKAEKMSREGWISLTMVVLAWVGASMSNGAWTQSIVDIRNEFGIDSTIIGYINSVFMLGGAIGSFLIPVIADKFGRKWGMFLCVALATVGCMLCGAAASVPFLIMARFMTVAGQSAE
jgi:MFS family permease